MRAAEVELRTEGVVRIMHPDRGMGVEFIQSTPEHRGLLEKFLSLLTDNRDVLPELLVEPEGLETEGTHSSRIPLRRVILKTRCWDFFGARLRLPPMLFWRSCGSNEGLAGSAGASG